MALEKAATIDKDKVTYIRINYVTSNRAATSTTTRIPAEVAVTPKAGSMTIGFDWTTGKTNRQNLTICGPMHATKNAMGIVTSGQPSKSLYTI